MPPDKCLIFLSCFISRTISVTWDRWANVTASWNNKQMMKLADSLKMKCSSLKNFPRGLVTFIHFLACRPTGTVRAGPITAWLSGWCWHDNKLCALDRNYEPNSHCGFSQGKLCILFFCVNLGVTSNPCPPPRHPTTTTNMHVAATLEGFLWKLINTPDITFHIILWYLPSWLKSCAAAGYTV